MYKVGDKAIVVSSWSSPELIGTLVEITEIDKNGEYSILASNHINWDWFAEYEIRHLTPLDELI
jgi:hypothetical protein